MGGENKGWPAGPLTDTKPGKVYIHAISDAKKLQWNDATKVPPPLDRVIIFAKRRERGAGWFIARAIWDSRGHNWVDPDAPDVRYSAAFVTYWHEDTLGAP